MTSNRLINALALAAAMFCSQVPAQARGEEPPSYAPSLLERLPSELEGYAPEGQQGQLQMQLLAFVGREDLIMRFEPGAFGYRDCPVLDGTGDPIAQIRDAARTAQIVIVNEAHDQPLHRAFIEDLALALAQDGFEVFAAETFNEVGLAHGPAEASGFYSREPIFTRQLRALNSAGYRFAAYEMTQTQRDPDAATVSEGIAAREEAQANNLIANVLAEDPDARVLVHVGYSHLFEASFTQGEGEAVITHVSRTVIAPEEASIPGLQLAEPVFRVEARLSFAEIDAYGEAIPLQPGLMLSADIIIDRRTFVEWLFDPLFAAGRRG